MSDLRRENSLNRSFRSPVTYTRESIRGVVKSGKKGGLNVVYRVAEVINSERMSRG